MTNEVKDNQQQIEQLNEVWAENGSTSVDEQETPETQEEQVKPEKKRETPVRKRFSAMITPDAEKTLKIMMTELGIDEGHSSASERNAAIFSLMLAILEAEIEMARSALGVRFVSEGQLKDYVARKYRDTVNGNGYSLFD